MSLVPRKFYLDSIFDDFMLDKPQESMKCDIYEKDGKYHIELDIPGFTKDDIKVEAEDGYLRVTAESNNEREDKGKNYIKKERSYGKISRQFYVGDTQNVEANFKDGILYLTVEKQDQTKNIKQIEIK